MEVLAAGPAEAMNRAKALLHQAWETALATQVEAERLAEIDNAASPDFFEGLEALLEKRDPVFSV